MRVDVGGGDASGTGRSERDEHEAIGWATSEAEADGRHLVAASGEGGDSRSDHHAAAQGVLELGRAVRGRSALGPHVGSTAQREPRSPGASRLQAQHLVRLRGGCEYLSEEKVRPGLAVVFHHEAAPPQQAPRVAVEVARLAGREGRCIAPLDRCEVEEERDLRRIEEGPRGHWNHDPR